MMHLLLLPAALFSIETSTPSGEAWTRTGVRMDTTMAVTSPRRLALDLKSGGTVKITGGASSVVRIRVYDGKKLCDDCRVQVEQTSRGLELHSAGDAAGGSKPSGLRFEIDVPSVFDVQLESAGGEVQIEGVAGRVSGQTQSGKLTLRRLSGDVDLETASGDVSVRESFVNGRVHTRGGRVTLEDVNGNIAGTTARGGVTERRVTRGPTT
jgi:hypothetical protein